VRRRDNTTFSVDSSPSGGYRRTAIKRVGGKSRILDWLLPHLEPSGVERYIEPYFGSGAVFFARPPADNEAINDIDGRLINFFRVLRDNGDGLRRRCEDTEYSRAVFDECAEPSDDPFIDAWRFYVRNRMSLFGLGITFHYGRGGAFPTPRRFAINVSNLDSFRDRLRNPVILNMPAVDFLREFSGSPGVFAYLDPPYPKTAGRDGKDGKRASYYEKDMEERDHVELLDVVDEFDGRVALSSYDNPLYSDRLRAPKWRKLVCPRRTTSRMACFEIREAEDERKKRTEVLFCNYESPHVRDAFAPENS